MWTQTSDNLKFNYKIWALRPSIKCTQLLFIVIKAIMIINHCAIRPPNPKTIFMKTCRVEIMTLNFVLFHTDRFFKVCCLFRQRFSAAYLLKLFLLPQRIYTTLFIRCDKSELDCWSSCSLHTGIQISARLVTGWSCTITSGGRNFLKKQECWEGHE